MKYSITVSMLCATLILALSSCGNDQQPEKVITIDSVVRRGAPVEWLLNDSITYSEELAKELGADEYGMKQYVMAYLKRGPKRDQDSATAEQLQKAHLENINRMAAEGKLVVAGPFMDDGDVRGIYIFNVTTVEEAKELTESDPAIKAGRLEMELHPWYGSAALMLNPRLHKLFEKKNVAE
jgi:uncharacterized protein YciI